MQYNSISGRWRIRPLKGSLQYTGFLAEIIMDYVNSQSSSGILIHVPATLLESIINRLPIDFTMTDI